MFHEVLLLSSEDAYHVSLIICSLFCIFPEENPICILKKKISIIHLFIQRLKKFFRFVRYDSKLIIDFSSKFRLLNSFAVRYLKINLLRKNKYLWWVRSRRLGSISPSPLRIFFLVFALEVTDRGWLYFKHCIPFSIVMFSPFSPIIFSYKKFFHINLRILLFLLVLYLFCIRHFLFPFLHLS